LSALTEMAVLLRPDNCQIKGVDHRIDMVRQIRRRLESQMQPEFNPALSQLLDEIVSMEESFAGEERQP